MKSDILSTIVAHKKEEVAAAKKRRPEMQLRDEAVRHPNRRSFIEALAQPGPYGVNVIAEIKRASPSKGLIRKDLDPAQYAAAYARGGAAALSVLTDQNFFKGGPDDLRQARDAVTLPVLRKDFIISSYQIYESAALGADAILLIVRMLSRQQLKDFLLLSKELNMDALVEIHSKQDLEIARQTSARLIGINNRNLSTFETRTSRAVEISAHLRPDQIGVSESGIQGKKDIDMIRGAGIFNFLIGESLVRSTHPEMFLKTLTGQDLRESGDGPLSGETHEN